MGLRFVEVDQGFELHMCGTLLLRHSILSPAFRVARGDHSILMKHGNFRISDSPRDTVAVPYASVSTTQVVLRTQIDAPPLLTLGLAQDNTLSIHCADPHIDRLWISLVAQPGETIWGGGEQMSYLQLNGRRFPMWTSEPGVGRDKATRITQLMDDQGMAGGDYWTTNYPQPTLISSRKYACHLESSAYSVLDFTDAGHHRIEVWQACVSLRFFQHETLAGLVGTMSQHFGRQPQLPDWAIGGAIIGLKDGARSFERLEAIIAAGADVAALWCEDWVGIRQTSFGRRLFWDWSANAQRYPGLAQQIANLASRGIRFLGYVNPYLAIDGAQFAEAAQAGFLALHHDRDTPYLIDFGEFDCGVVDFTNPAACDWFAERIIGKEMLDFGLSGWMADFGEYLPVDLRLSDGSDPMLMHNLWPVLWARVNASAIAQRGKTGDAVFFMRAGFSGVQQYCPLLWAGDQSVDFTRHDGIGTAITAALSAGLVGNAYSHSDVGGYTSVHGNVRTAELIMRWSEMAAFTPVMRTHEGNRPDDNLQIDSDPAILSHFAAMTRVHAALAPYVRALCQEAQATGLPLQRPLFLHYPDDQDVQAIQDSYLYGADMLVAPVIEQGAVRRQVYLPDSGWLHLWTGRALAHGWHDVAAPIGMPPVFFRPDSAFAPLFAGIAAMAWRPQ